MEYLLSHGSNQYRVLPMNGTDPMLYATNRIPVMFTSNPVQQQRWQDFLDSFQFPSSMPDLINLKYLVYEPHQYEQEKGSLGEKYVPVFQLTGRKGIILENHSVLPKAWLVQTVAVFQDPRRPLPLCRALNSTRETLPWWKPCRLFPWLPRTCHPTGPLAA